MDLGSFNGGTYTLNPGSVFGVRTDSNFRDHILRVGLNYTFGGPVVARY
jgi:outer membrane immunogenic protein